LKLQRTCRSRRAIVVIERAELVKTTKHGEAIIFALCRSRPIQSCNGNSLRSADFVARTPHSVSDFGHTENKTSESTATGRAVDHE
jgi:hypothetical protein